MDGQGFWIQASRSYAFGARVLSWGFRFRFGVWGLKGGFRVEGRWGFRLRVLGSWGLGPEGREVGASDALRPLGFGCWGVCGCRAGCLEFGVLDGLTLRVQRTQ